MFCVILKLATMNMQSSLKAISYCLGILGCCLQLLPCVRMSLVFVCLFAFSTYSVVCLLVVFFNHLLFFYSVTFGSLGRNQITDKFACSLAQALQVNQSLQKLE